jgi:hypothetical protein
MVRAEPSCVRERFYRPPQLRSVYGLWPAVTLPGSIDGDVASHVCPAQSGFGLRSWTVSLGSRWRCIAVTCGLADLTGLPTRCP